MGKGIWGDVMEGGRKIKRNETCVRYIYNNLKTKLFLRIKRMVSKCSGIYRFRIFWNYHPFLVL